MSECPGYKTSGLCSCCEGPGHVVHCSGCSAHGGDRLTPEEREIVEYDRGRSTIYMPELLIDIIDRLAPKPEVP